MTDDPLITVIMPIRNEAGTIATAVRSVLDQDYPPARMEVLVVDGRSTDDTRAIVTGVAEQDARVRLLDNPAGIVPPALNIGIEQAAGDVIVRVDGHCTLERDYLRRCVHLLETTSAACVGGMIESRSMVDTTVARAIALALATPFGAGAAGFRTGRAEPGPVDTLLFGAYRREVFDEIGVFDEELVRNQDDEFNLRLTRSGGQIWMDPSIRSIYRSRSTLRALWRQYYEYGVYKVRVAQKHRGVASWRHLVPFAFVFALASATLVSLVAQTAWPVLAIVVPYAAVSCIAAVLAGRRDPITVPVLPLVFATLHLAYGSGWAVGFWRWRHRFGDRSGAD